MCSALAQRIELGILSMSLQKQRIMGGTGTPQKPSLNAVVIKTREMFKPKSSVCYTSELDRRGHDLGLSLNYNLLHARELARGLWPRNPCVLEFKCVQPCCCWLEASFTVVTISEG